MRARLLALSTAAVLVAVFFLRPHATPGPPMRDFEAYYAGGAVWNAGGNPYSQAIWTAEKQLPGVDARRYEALPFVDPPATLPLFGLLARLPFQAANIVWRSLLVVSLAVFALVTLMLARRRITAASLVAIAAVAMGFGPLTSALALGQLALPAALFATAALAWPAFGTLAWIQPNIAIALCSLAFTRRGATALAIGVALFGAASLAVAGGVRGIEQYAALLHRHELAERFSAIQITPAAVAYGFGATPEIANAIGTLTAIAAGCSSVLLMLRAPDIVTRFCITCALVPLAMPFVHEHTLLIAFVPAVTYAVRADARAAPLALAGALLAGTDWLGLAQRPDGALQTLLLVGACACGIIALRNDAHRRMLATSGAVIGAIVLAAAAAHAHPAPVWPDAMGALPRGAQRTDVAAAWHAQQLATGLMVQNVVWAALRMLSLLGCAVTATAIAASLKSPADSKTPSPAPA
jgi:hypothetical protein